MISSGGENICNIKWDVGRYKNGKPVGTFAIVNQ